MSNYGPQPEAAAIGSPRLAPNASARTPGARWVRTFVVTWHAVPAAPAARENPVGWDICVLGRDAPDRSLLRGVANDGPLNGLMVWVGSTADEQLGHDIFAICQSARVRGVSHLAICHAGLPLAGFARSLALERQFDTVLLIERTPTTGVDGIASELATDSRPFREIRLAKGMRYEPRFALVAPRTARSATSMRGNSVLVTGGTKGIGAECALRFGQRTGAALALVGRSPEQDPAVAHTLARARGAGLRCSYAVADVADAAAMASAAARARQELGPIAALIHAAGFNETKLFHNVTPLDLSRIMAAKPTGLRIATAAAGADLRQIVAFGSILAQMGLKGEAHYALANAWQSRVAEEIAAERPECEVLSLEWSIWDGAGMGYRHGGLDALARFGVDAIALRQGLDTFDRLTSGGLRGSLIVTSRFGPPSYVTLAGEPLPALTWADEVLVYYPGLEIVARAQFSHHGAAGAMFEDALHAMADLAGILLGAPAVLTDAPVVPATPLLPPSAAPVHVTALAVEDGRVEATLRIAGEQAEVMRASFIAAVSLAVPLARRSDVADRGHCGERP